jgi:hypothetical protein
MSYGPRIPLRPAETLALMRRLANGTPLCLYFGVSAPSLQVIKENIPALELLAIMRVCTMKQLARYVIGAPTDPVQPVALHEERQHVKISSKSV